jgi:hypothetical protein
MASTVLFLCDFLDEVFEEVKKFVLAIEYSNSNNEKVTV